MSADRRSIRLSSAILCLKALSGGRLGIGGSTTAIRESNVLAQGREAARSGGPHGAWFRSGGPGAGVTERGSGLAMQHFPDSFQHPLANRSGRDFLKPQGFLDIHCHNPRYARLIHGDTCQMLGHFHGDAIMGDKQELRLG